MLSFHKVAASYFSKNFLWSDHIQNVIIHLEADPYKAAIFG